jgi:hypothetical protein
MCERQRRQTSDNGDVELSITQNFWNVIRVYYLWLLRLIGHGYPPVTLLFLVLSRMLLADQPRRTSHQKTSKLQIEHKSSIEGNRANRLTPCGTAHSTPHDPHNIVLPKRPVHML